MSFVEPLTTEIERRLFAMLQSKWRKMSNMQFRKGIVRIKSVTDEWESYIKDSGMTFLTLESSVLKFRKSLDPKGENHYVIDPVCLNPTYIVVSDDLAMKILTLGELP